MKPILTAFKDSPDEGQGQARDMPVRWAFEEAGKAYDVRLVTFAELETPEYLALQPFGFIPAYQEGELTLFESAAIVLRIAESGLGLLPAAAGARSRAITWMFAAKSTIEPPIVELEIAEYTEQEKSWYAERVPMIEGRIREALSDLSRYLGNRDWLEGEFTAGDLMMITVLRRVEGSRLLSEFPNLLSYVARGKARPAFQRAFAAQRAVFECHR